MRRGRRSSPLTTHRSFGSVGENMGIRTACVCDWLSMSLVERFHRASLRWHRGLYPYHDGNGVS
jgi:hypothetical protein